VARGFYELIRVATLESFDEAPQKIEVDTWMRGLSLFSFAIGTPLARLKLPKPGRGDEELYRGSHIDVFQSVEAGLVHTREVLFVLGSMLRKNSFTVSSRRKLLAVLPEVQSISPKEIAS
jgi:hypothetical protein